MEPNVDNIIDVYRRATVEQFLEGKNWYPSALKLSRELDPENVNRAAGIIAAFSPQCPWWRNVELVKRIYATGEATGHTGVQCAKAQAIFEGADPAIVLGGKKTTNFYHNIVSPLDSSTVTIDGHAFDIAIGMQTGEWARKSLQRKGVYERFADAYRHAAILFNIPAPTMQAVTWVRWRIENGIK